LHASGSLDILDLDGPDPEGAAIVVSSRRRIAHHAQELRAQQQNVSKCVSVSFKNAGVDEDAKKRRHKVDYIGFAGPHTGSATLIYTVPNLGWEADAAAQREKLLNSVPTHKKKLPKINSRRIKS
jgi:hypothetical protein